MTLRFKVLCVTFPLCVTVSVAFMISPSVMVCSAPDYPHNTRRRIGFFFKSLATVPRSRILTNTKVKPFFSLTHFIFLSGNCNMEGNVISVGPWGLEEGIPFHQKSDGMLRKIVLIYDGGVKALTAKYSTSNTHVCSDSNELSKKLQEMLSNSPKSSNIIKNAEQIYMGSIYEVSADVSVKGGGGKKFEMCATIKIENLESSISHLHVGRVEVTDLQWAKLECSFSLNTIAKSLTFYVEGPSGGVDLLIRRVSISPVLRKFVIKLEDPHEYLTGISGYCRKLQQGMSEAISSLTFKSNLRTYGPYGTEEGKFFSFKTADAVVVGFHGTSNNYLKSIGLYIKPLRSTKPILLSADHSMLISSSSSDSYEMA